MRPCDALCVTDAVRVCEPLRDADCDRVSVCELVRDPDRVAEDVSVRVIDGVIDCVCVLVVAAPLDPPTMMPPMYLDAAGPFVSHVVGAHVEATADVPTPNAPTDESPHVSTEGVGVGGMEGAT